MALPVKHEITLVAFGRDCGRVVVCDVIETSRKNAYFFMRRFYRDSEVIEVAAVTPKSKAEFWYDNARLIFRTGREIISNPSKYETGYRG